MNTILTKDETTIFYKDGAQGRRSFFRMDGR